MTVCLHPWRYAQPAARWPRLSSIAACPSCCTSRSLSAKHTGVARLQNLNSFVERIGLMGGLLLVAALARPRRAA